MQRAAPASLLDFRFCLTRIPQSRLGSHGDKGVQFWIESLDALKAELRQLNGRDLSLAQKLRDLFDRQPASIIGGIRAQGGNYIEPDPHSCFTVGPAHPVPKNRGYYAQLGFSGGSPGFTGCGKMGAP